MCLLDVESTRHLPRAPHRGSVRLEGAEKSMTGLHPVRLLRFFEIELREVSTSKSTYAVAIDISDDVQGAFSQTFMPAPARRVTEPVETICKRVAGIFARHCEGYRPPTVAVTLEP